MGEAGLATGEGGNLLIRSAWNKHGLCVLFAINASGGRAARPYSTFTRQRPSALAPPARLPGARKGTISARRKVNVAFPPLGFGRHYRQQRFGCRDCLNSRRAQRFDRYRLGYLTVAGMHQAKAVSASDDAVFRPLRFHGGPNLCGNDDTPQFDQNLVLFFRPGNKNHNWYPLVRAVLTAAR